MRITFVAAVLSLFVSSCYYDKEDKLYERYIANQKCDTASVTYSKTIEPIIAAQCATIGCHVTGGSAPGVFDGYTGVKTRVDNGSMLNRVVNIQDMPPVNRLTSCEIKQVSLWIAAGAPNN